MFGKTKDDLHFDSSIDRIYAEEKIRRKLEANDFDVFLCHNSEDKSDVKSLGIRLKQKGYLPWLDEWNLQPGFPWQKSLEKEIHRIKSAAVVVGKSGIGPWQDMEIEAFLREFVKRRCPVIPVILPNCTSVPRIPTFLGNMTWVDFRKLNPDPMDRLIWGITGCQPGTESRKSSILAKRKNKGKNTRRTN